jgi:hypothetical protein
MEAKIMAIIEHFNKRMNRYKSNGGLDDNYEGDGQSKEQENKNATKKTTPQSAIVMSSSEHDKMVLIINTLIYYSIVVRELLAKNASVNSKEWLAKPRFYCGGANLSDVVVKTMHLEVKYGFDYYSQWCRLDDSSSLVYHSAADMEYYVYYLASIIKSKASPLVHGHDSSQQTPASVLKSFARLLGYETHSFLCSSQTTNESLNNVCKAMCLGGYWLALLNINNLSSQLMSSLSNILTQINERRPLVLVNNEECKLHAAVDTTNQRRLFSYFATIQSCSDHYLTDESAGVDSLKITRINHEFTLISKDLFEKFRVMKTRKTAQAADTFVMFNLITNGFSSNTSLCNELSQLEFFYKNFISLKQNRIGQ